MDIGGFSGWYHNYLAGKNGDLEESLGVDPVTVTDNKETVKNSDSDDHIEEDESEIITLDLTDDSVDSTTQDDDMIIPEQTAEAGDGSDLDSVEESVDNEDEEEKNIHAIFISVDSDVGFKRQVVGHVLPS